MSLSNQHITNPHSITYFYLNADDTNHGLSDNLHINEYQYYKELNSRKTVFSSNGELTCCASQPMEYKLNQNEQTVDYLLFPYLFSLGLLVFSIVRYRHYLQSFFESLVYKYIGDKIVNDINVPIRKLSFNLDALLTLFIGFFGINTIKQFDIFAIGHVNEIKYFSIIVGGFIGYRIINLLIVEIIKSITYNKRFVQKLQFDSLLIYRLMGLVLLPLSFAIHYSQPAVSMWLYYIVLATIVVVVIFRFFRLLLLFLQNGISFLYFILYLCTLEIIPILVVYKLV